MEYGVRERNGYLIKNAEGTYFSTMAFEQRPKGSE